MIIEKLTFIQLMIILICIILLDIGPENIDKIYIVIGTIIFFSITIIKNELRRQNERRRNVESN